MTLPEAQVEYLHPIRMLVEQKAQITGVGAAGGDSEKHVGNGRITKEGCILQQLRFAEKGSGRGRWRRDSIESNPG